MLLHGMLEVADGGYVMRSWVWMATLLMLGACSTSLGEVVVASERDAGRQSESSKEVADDEAATTKASAEPSESPPAGMSYGPGAAMEA